MPELKPLPGSIGLDDVMEAVDYHAKACVDRAAGGKVDTASTRLKLSLLIAHYAENRRTPPEQPAAPSVAPEPPTREALAEIVRSHLTSTYHCTRVWEAWSVGTMTEDDFEPASESGMAEDIADAILAANPPRAPLTAEFERECAAVDELLKHFGVDPERCRTEGGALNVSRTKTLLGNWAVTDEMVTRFLGWKLPADFSPDAGITFKRVYNEQSPFGPQNHEPTGTNLLSGEQARAMLEHVLGLGAGRVG